MDGLQIAGLVLVVAGVLWFFVVGFLKEPIGAATLTKSSNPFTAFLEWLAKLVDKLPNKYLPGVVLIAFGALLLIPWGDFLDNDTQSTTTTTTP